MRLTLHPYHLRVAWRLTLLPPPKSDLEQWLDALPASVARSWAPEPEVEIDGRKLSPSNVRKLRRAVEKHVAMLGDKAPPEAFSVLRRLRSKMALP
jgi:hypothetical protein